MNPVSLDKLLEKGDVFRIVDTADVAFGRLFVYRGRMSGYNILDEIGGDRNPIAVEHLPEYAKFFRLRGVPQPDDRISNERYKAVLEDLIQNFEHLQSVLKLKLSFTYDEPTYEERGFEEVDAERRETGKARYFIIKKSGLSFRQEVPSDGLFSSVVYRLSDSGILVDTGISFSNLDSFFGLGYKDKNLRYRNGKMTYEEMQEPVYDKEKFAEVFEKLKQKGILVYEIRRDRLPVGTWEDGPEFYKIFNHVMSAEIVATPVNDAIGDRMYFESLGEAQKYMQGLFEQTQQLALEHQTL